MSEVPAIAFVTLGCPKNEVDSDRMAARIEASAYRLVTDIEEADVVVLNTCAFIQAATEEAIAETFALLHKWRPVRENRKLIVAGCMVSRYGSELIEALPEADAFLAVADEDSLLPLLEALLKIPSLPTSSAGRTHSGPVAYLKISEGCDRQCSYCTIPAIRGPFVSVNPYELTEEARFLIATGARELILVAQDAASYGMDHPEFGDLAGLVERLDALEGDFWIRLMYLQPDQVTDRLIDVVAQSKHVCHYFDIPVQHASERVLSSMRRPGYGEIYLELLERIRKRLPDVTLRTTVIAGFPGETEDDLTELENFLEQAAFDYVGVFAYSPEEGTAAVSLPGQLSEKTRAERAQCIRDVADRVSFQHLQRHVGQVQRVLVEGEEDEELYGRTYGQAPQIDGLTLMSGDIRPGEFVMVRITEALGYDLVGEPQ